MIGKRPLQMALATPIGLAALLLAEPVLACSVCAGGDPNSSMNQGARAGMLILLGVEAGWLLRILPNQLYYAFFVPFAYLRFDWQGAAEPAQRSPAER